MLDAQRLVVLVEVAHAGSIAAAAQRLAFTPSAVSQQLGKLERDLDARLLDRHPRGVSLTAIGQALLVHAEKVVGELRAAEQTVHALLDTHPAHLAVGAFASAGATLVPQMLAQFRRAHPSVALTLLDLEPPDGYGLVSSRDLDVLITHRYPGVPLPDRRGLHRQLLMKDTLRLVLPTEHPHALDGRVTLAQLADEEWISGSHGVPNRICLQQLARAAGIDPRVAYETCDYQVTLALIEAGLGIALVPTSVLDHTSNAGLAIKQLTGTAPAREVYLVHHSHPTPLVTDMIQQLRPARDEAGLSQRPATDIP